MTMRRLAATVCFSLLSLLPAAGRTSVAYGPRSMVELIETSRFVADVTVEANLPERLKSPDTQEYRYSDALLKVQETLKGEPLPPVIVVDSPKLKAGQRYIIF